VRVRRTRASAVGGLAAIIVAFGLAGQASADDPTPPPTPTPTPTPAAAAAPAAADAPPTTDAGVTSTGATSTSTTTPTTTTTASTTTPRPPTTTTVPKPTAPTIDLSQLAPAPAPTPGCAVVAALVVRPPHGAPRVVGPFVSATAAPSTTPLAYPADGSLVAATSVGLSATCRPGRPPIGTVVLSSPSFLGGLVTASSITLTITPTGRHATLKGLQVNGQPEALPPGGTLPLAGWGSIRAPAPPVTPLRAPATARPPTPDDTSAFSIVLARPYAGLPAGTVLFAADATSLPAPPPLPTEGPPAVAAGPVKAAKLAERPPVAKPGGKIETTLHEPLTVTPPLTAGPYDFPVAGGVSFGDTYGAARSDVSGGWHHGDDIFASLGTPVVAVADGTLNRVGWERIGGWRLWVRDRAGDEFYYAHLSGYSPLAMKDGRVHAGEVIGFVGNTGDAFTTFPHLHFEVHPRSLLHLQYDGAVDPTTYLEAWHRLDHVRASAPVHPPLPALASARDEAVQNFRELLAARGLTPHLSVTPLVGMTRPLAVLEGVLPLAASSPQPALASSSPSAAGAIFVVAGGCAAALAAVAAGFLLWRRRRLARQST
jgi:murein DD-endopeptidase MepM/ murein hydrolase activator NlpD